MMVCMKTITKKSTVEKKNKVCVALGKRLKKIRISADKSQETLAFDACVDRTFISAIERGIANPSVVTLSNICYALNISLADLFAELALSLKPDENSRRMSAEKQQSLKPKRPRLR